ncbi:MAG: hypothetical protein GC181_15625 [Bacteroidetes bacterium]|nr:hypothetical protein [Bacteroidota bacterium]
MYTRRAIKQESGPLADLAFMLLLFFMVTTNINRDEAGIPAQLPPEGRSGTPSLYTMHVMLNGENKFLIDGKIYRMGDEIQNYIHNQLRSYDKLNIELQTHEAANYDTYVQLYDQVRRAYHLWYDELAEEKFGKTFSQIGVGEKSEIVSRHPMRISEAM